MLILWALTSVMMLAVGVMAIFQVWLIIKGETAVESQDNGESSPSFPPSSFRVPGEGGLMSVG